MALANLHDLLKLYKTPKKTENPAVQSRAALKRILAASGTAFPLIHVRGYLTYHAIPEKDGDFHFYIETRDTADQPEAPMQTCEIQGMNVQPEDSRTVPFRHLFGAGELEITGLIRGWPEHLRDSTQPHLFEIHPLLTIGLIGGPKLDFLDRVIWPTGEDEAEPSRSWRAVTEPPQGLNLQRQADRILFKHPKKSFKKENYVHLDGHYTGKQQPVDQGVWITLHEQAAGGRAIEAFVLNGSPVFGQIGGLAQGRYRAGGLCGFDLAALADATPDWKTVLSPLLSLEAI